MSQVTQILKQPPVFKLALLTSLCERFGYYVITFLLVLYAKGEYKLSDSKAFTLFGIFTALAYLMTTAGGYLADNVFGIRRCIIVGLVLEGFGLILLAIPSPILFPLALAFVIMGVGLYKTAPTHLMGRSYEKHDSRIDRGFTLYYMGMNVGLLLAALVTSLAHRYLGWHIAFLIGGVAVFVGLLFYYRLRKSAKSADSDVGRKSLSIRKWVFVLAGIFGSILMVSWVVTHTTLANVLLIASTVFVLFYFFYEMAKSPRDEKLKIVACVMLIFMGFIFFVFFQQAYTSIILFINRCVARRVFGVVISTEAFFALAPFWVIVLCPVMTWVYYAINQRTGKDLSMTIKFPVGLLMISLCFLTLALGAFFHNLFFQVNLFWIVLAFFFCTLGELLVSALGVAMVTHIAPKRLYGLMMGAWYLMGMALSAALSGQLAKLTSVSDYIFDPNVIVHIYARAFLEMGYIGLLCTVICFALGQYIKKVARLD